MGGIWGLILGERPQTSIPLCCSDYYMTPSPANNCCEYADTSGRCCDSSLSNNVYPCACANPNRRQPDGRCCPSGLFWDGQTCFTPCPDPKRRQDNLKCCPENSVARGDSCSFRNVTSYCPRQRMRPGVPSCCPDGTVWSLARHSCLTPEEARVAELAARTAGYCPPERMRPGSPNCCPEGTVWSPGGGNCLTPEVAKLVAGTAVMWRCPDLQLAPDGSCCPPGTIWRGGGCKPPGTASPLRRPGAGPGVPVSATRACLAGTHWDGSGCIPDAPRSGSINAIVPRPRAGTPSPTNFKTAPKVGPSNTTNAPGTSKSDPARSRNKVENTGQRISDRYKSGPGKHLPKVDKRGPHLRPAPKDNRRDVPR